MLLNRLSLLEKETFVSLCFMYFGRFLFIFVPRVLKVYLQKCTFGIKKAFTFYHNNYMECQYKERNV